MSLLSYASHFFFFFFFNDTATTEIYTLSLHDALPISSGVMPPSRIAMRMARVCPSTLGRTRDRKSTRLNSSHSQISYAVFCLKKKKKTPTATLHHTIYPYQYNYSPHLSTDTSQSAHSD